MIGCDIMYWLCITILNLMYLVMVHPINDLIDPDIKHYDHSSNPFKRN